MDQSEGCEYQCQGDKDIKARTVFPANQILCVTVLTNQRPRNVLTHLIVTENCIWLFLRQKVSSQTSSLCCHCHCGILNKHRHLDNLTTLRT